MCKIRPSTTVNVTPDADAEGGEEEEKEEEKTRFLVRLRKRQKPQVLQSGVNVASHSFFRNRLFKRYLEWSFSKANSLLQKKLCEATLAKKCNTRLVVGGGELRVHRLDALLDVSGGALGILFAAFCTKINLAHTGILFDKTSG